MISAKPFVDAWEVVAVEYPGLKSEFREKRAMVKDVIDGVIITKSKSVQIRTMDGAVLMQAFRVLLNYAMELKRPILTCLPLKGECSHIYFCDPVNGIIFECRQYEGFQKTIIEIILTWGEKS